MLFQRKPQRLFDAYVNVMSLADSIPELARLYPDSKFIMTVAAEAVKDPAPPSSGNAQVTKNSGNPHRNVGSHDERSALVTYGETTRVTC